MVAIELSKPMTQGDFGLLVGVSQQAVSDFVRAAELPQQLPAGDMLLAYCHRLREQAAGRLGGEVGGLDLVQERAALARSQRIAQDLKNSVARREYAPIDILADVLATASSAVVDGFEQLEGMLQKACPDLPDEAKSVVQQVIAKARNQWITATDRRVLDRVDSMAPAEDDAAPIDNDMDEATGE